MKSSARDSYSPIKTMPSGVRSAINWVSWCFRAELKVEDAFREKSISPVKSFSDKLNLSPTRSPPQASRSKLIRPFQIQISSRGGEVVASDIVKFSLSASEINRYLKRCRRSRCNVTGSCFCRARRARAEKREETGEISSIERNLNCHSGWHGGKIDCLR